MKYNISSNVIELIDGKGEAETCKFDSLGRRYLSTDRIGALTASQFDENVSLLSVIDDQWSQTSYEYDVRNLTFKITYLGHVVGTCPGDADYRSVEYTCDPILRTLVMTDQQGDTQTQV